MLINQSIITFIAPLQGPRSEALRNQSKEKIRSHHQPANLRIGTVCEAAQSQGKDKVKGKTGPDFRTRQVHTRVKRTANSERVIFIRFLIFENKEMTLSDILKYHLFSV